MPHPTGIALLPQMFVCKVLENFNLMQFRLLSPPAAVPMVLLDRFLKGARYAPSCQLLQINQNQQRPHFQNLFAIQNPANDLPYADLELATIRSSFPVTQVLVKQEKTKTAL